jgi:MFS family permease
MQALRRQLVDSLHAFASLYRNPSLRRLQLAWIGSSVGTWGYVVALTVYAYRHGGPAAVGLVGLIRWFPAAIAAPFGGMLGDRFPRLRVMVVSDFVRAAALAAAAVAIVLSAPTVVVYALAILVTVTSQVFQPAESALLPTIAESPEELAAANVANSTIEYAGYFVGPALGGVLLAVSNVQTVFAATAAAFLWSAAMLVLIHMRAPEPAREPGRASWQHEALAGFRTVWQDSRLRLIVALFGAQTLVYGGLTVLIAVASIRLLGLGSPGIGYLNSALGVGGLIGGFVAVTLVGARRLALIFGVGLLLWGTPILLLGLWAKAGPAFLLIGLAGLGMTLADVAGFTLLQRAVPEAVLARVFGVLHSAFYAAGGIGAIIAPALVSWLGIKGALIVTGAVLPVITAPCFGMLGRIDRSLTVPTAQLDALRAIEMFAPLPVPTLEALAMSLARIDISAGETLFRQGDHGDRFYIIESGEVEIEIDGRVVNVLEPGDHFGEIALLRDIPRTATARSRKETRLFALERDSFLGAVTGHAESSEAAESVVFARLGLTGST